ncbi:hypothetical protein QQY24_06105 [Streptomyces sp. TG1A-8]|uniref:hypothetical protein n=1 Tax=Streptomyces sp. TG1A-8 TaxID=3051385 RepID=UPI00265C081B|nr:hypothetical protein [Streptomyces sp. TG1A-8]MDO0925008.1 hypothetical protein [Streptomyces sp. TG1A-8]
MNDVDPWSVLPREEEPLPRPPAPAPHHLPWRPSRDGAAVTPLAEALDAGAHFDLGLFGRRLKEAEVLDAGAIAAPGAMIMLPFGMGLIRRLDVLARDIYEAEGYREYDYPHLLPAPILDPTRQVLPGAPLLYAGDDADWAAGHRKAVLSPTGEAAVYTHWAQTVRQRSDLPLHVYRRARYFRPARAGGSVFRSAESGDVYEFQSCFPDSGTAARGFTNAVTMARRLCSAMHVPALWSTRPPWTNNTSVANVTVGADTPLPHGSTVQVGCVYDQGTRFSRPYGIAHRDSRGRHFTHHVTGALTRRLVLTHLVLGMDAHGELLIHPDLAPVQVALTLAGGTGQDRADAEALVTALGQRNIRCELHVGDRRETGRLHRRWRRQGVPLRVYLQPRRDADDAIRVVVVRADTREEAVFRPRLLPDLASVLPAALGEVGIGYLRRSLALAARRVRIADRATVRDVLATRSAAVVPLEPTEEAVDEVASWGQGEVLGLRRVTATAPCIHSGRPTDTVAYVSPRV